MGLKVGIVGAGIAGLSAAIALRRAGHECEVYEKSQFRNEVGAAASIPPNGGRILSRWGFNSTRAGGIDNLQVRRPLGSDLSPMAPTLDFSHVESRYGHRWLMYHRADMHKELRILAEDPSLPAKACVIHLGCAVMGIDPDMGTITLKDGSTITKDLIITADGQHDRLNMKVTGVDVPMQRSGQTAFRCLIPMKDVLEDEVTKPLFENQPYGFWAPALPSKGVMCVTYPCRRGEILNCLIVHRKLGQHTTTAQEEETIEDWNFPATPSQLASVLSGFHPAVQTLMLKSPDIKVYTQMKRQPLPVLYRGKAVLIGDAAHPMLLTHAQGFSSAIEDAAALEVLLSDVPSYSSSSSPTASGSMESKDDGLSARLSLFNALRLPRTSLTQILTDPIPPIPPPGTTTAALLDCQLSEIRKYYDGPLPPLEMMKPHSETVCDFFFDYDVRREAEGVLKRYLEGLGGKAVG